MAIQSSIADRLERFNWMGESTTRYERLKSGITTLNPWKRRLLYLLPPLLILTWITYIFNPFTTTIPSTDNSGDDASIKADITTPVTTPTAVAPPAQTVFVQVPVKQKYNETKVAFLMESRPIPHLAPLLLHMINVVPVDWKFRFMGSEESIKFINSSLPVQMYEKTGKLDMVRIPPNVTYKGQQELSETFTNLWFYETVLAPAEHLLVFQTDSIMCANSGKDLNDWLQYDWVGAPWVPNAESGGNGGLSLRKVSSIIKVLKQEERKKGDTELEDLWLCNRLKHLPGINMADGTTESHFSVEAVWQDRPMGYHTGWSGARLPDDVWGTAEKRKKIYDYCPEMKITMNMKLEREGCEDKSAKRDSEGSMEKYYIRAW